MVLCAGLGSRLGAITAHTPKPMLPLGDAPLLERILASLAAQGIDRVLINTHHLASAFERLRSEIAVGQVFEHEIRGTAGGVGAARRFLGAPLLVWNGDIAANPPVADLFAAVQSGGVCLLAKGVPSDRPGTLGLDGEGRVVRLRGEVFGQEQQSADYTGILALGSDVFDQLPEFGCLIGDVCLPRLRRGEPIATLPYDGPWSDIGSVAAYHELNMTWLAHRGSCFVHPEANIAADVELVDCAVHSGAVVTGQGTLTRCILLPGARAEAPEHDIIAFDGGQFVAVSHVRS